MDSWNDLHLTSHSSKRLGNSGLVTVSIEKRYNSGTGLDQTPAAQPPAGPGLGAIGMGIPCSGAQPGIIPTQGPGDGAGVGGGGSVN